MLTKTIKINFDSLKDIKKAEKQKQNYESIGYTLLKETKDKLIYGTG